MAEDAVRAGRGRGRPDLRRAGFNDGWLEQAAQIVAAQPKRARKR